MIIVGAGLAGLVAAHVWQNAPIVEALPEPRETHHALLRFRTNAIAALTGIDFRKVRVHKGIWYEGAFVTPNIRVANLYAQKCGIALSGDRSIWHIESTDRWVAPENFYFQMLDCVRDRITWNQPFSFARHQFRSVISTAPMPTTLKACGVKHDAAMFERAPIHVERFRLSGVADVYQTVYFPSEEHSMYRASITGSLLIVEHAVNPYGAWEEELVRAFGFSSSVRMTSVSAVTQQYGKIIPLPSAVRKSILFELTSEHRVYSFGRFATWRNILLDDLVQDAAVIKSLMNAEHLYDLRLAAARGSNNECGRHS